MNNSQTNDYTYRKKVVGSLPKIWQETFKCWQDILEETHEPE
jgi:hypothetical protein